MGLLFFLKVLLILEDKCDHFCTALELTFPSSVKTSKSGRCEATPAKGSLTSGKPSPQGDIPAEPQAETDLNLSAKLNSSLRMLRTVLIKEAGEGVMAYHIFGNAILQQISTKIPRSKEELLEISGIDNVKINKYGDRVLETIEATINEHYKTGNSSNDSTDSAKRRIDMVNNSKDEDFMDSTRRSKKRAVKRTNQQPVNIIEYEYQLKILVILNLSFNILNFHFLDQLTNCHYWEIDTCPREIV